MNPPISEPILVVGLGCSVGETGILTASGHRLVSCGFEKDTLFFVAFCQGRLGLKNLFANSWVFRTKPLKVKLFSRGAESHRGFVGLVSRDKKQLPFWELPWRQTQLTCPHLPGSDITRCGWWAKGGLSAVPDLQQSCRQEATCMQHAHNTSWSKSSLNDVE